MTESDEDSAILRRMAEMAIGNPRSDEFIDGPLGVRPGSSPHIEQTHQLSNYRTVCGLGPTLRLCPSIFVNMADGAELPDLAEVSDSRKPLIYIC